MPCRLPLILCFLAYGLIAGVVADIPTFHTTLNALDSTIAYQPTVANPGSDCAHVQCHGWWFESASEPLHVYGLMKSTTTPDSQLYVKFLGSTFVAIAGHMDAGCLANVTINGQPYSVSQMTHTSIFEQHSLDPTATQEMQLTYTGPGKLSIAALYFDRAVVVNPPTPQSSESKPYPSKPTASPTTSLSRTSKPPSPATPSLTANATLGPGAVPNGPTETTANEWGDGAQRSSATNGLPTDNPSSEARSPAPSNVVASSDPGSRRGAIVGGCVAGVLALMLVCAGLLLLRRRLIARRAASHDFIRARAVAAWNDHWTLRPSSPALDAHTWGHTSEAGASQPSHAVHAM